MATTTTTMRPFLDIARECYHCRHQDVHFCCALAKYVNVKCFTLEFNEMIDDCAAEAVHDDDDDVEVFADSMWPRLAPVQPVSSDDKAKAPVGEPGKPVDVGVRPASKSLCHENVELLALDHGWHRASITPSVNLIQNIPGSVPSCWREATMTAAKQRSGQYNHAIGAKRKAPKGGRGGRGGGRARGDAPRGRSRGRARS